jgi:hypothetical protein
LHIKINSKILLKSNSVFLGAKSWQHLQIHICFLILLFFVTFCATFAKIHSCLKKKLTNPSLN